MACTCETDVIDGGRCLLAANSGFSPDRLTWMLSMHIMDMCIFLCLM